MARNTRTFVPDNVIVSAPGMYEMGRSINAMLNEMDGPTFTHLEASCDAFPNGELEPIIPETVRGQHVFLLHPLQKPNPNTAIMSLYLMNEALARASASGITDVLPFMPYLRQDRRNGKRTSVSARSLADLIQLTSKVERIITFDTHSDQVEGFFRIPVENINARSIHAEYFRQMFGGDLSNVRVISPDFGATVRASRFADELGGVPVYIMYKKRDPSSGTSETIGFMGGEIADLDLLLYDDMIDTGGTIRGAVDKIRDQKPRSIRIAATHGIFSNNSEAKFKIGNYDVVVTDSIAREEAYWQEHDSWLKRVSIDAFLANAIHEAATCGGSVSKLSAPRKTSK